MKYLRVGPRVAATALSVTAATLLWTLPADAARGRSLRAVGTVEAVTAATLGPPATPASVSIRTAAGVAAYVVTDQTQVVVEGEASTFGSVLVGDEARVEYAITTGTTTSFTAVKLETQRPREEVFGLVTQVQKNEDGSVSVTINPPFGETKVLKADESTEAKVEGHGEVDLVTATEEQLASLKKMYAGARYLKGGDLAKEMVFQKARRLPYKGTIKSVDAAAHTFVVGYQEEELSLVEVAGSTIVRLNGKQVTLADLQAGDRCEGFWVMVLDDTSGAVSNVATHVKAHWPRPVEYSGTIAVVSPAPPAGVTVAGAKAGEVSGSVQGTFTLTLRNGETVEVTVYESTRIKVDGKLKSFSDLAQGQKCHFLATPRPAGDKTRLDCYRLEAKQPRPSAS